MSAPTFVLRPPTAADHGAIAELLSDCDEHDLGEGEPPESVLIDLGLEWGQDGFDPERDAWLAVGRDGTAVGYAHLRTVSDDEVFIAATHGVAPEHRRQGIGSALVSRAEERGRELVAPGKIKAVVSGDVPGAHALLAGRGYEITEQSWRMGIDLDAKPPEPTWPAGVTVRGYERGSDERPLYDLVREAFLDNEGYQWSATYETWTSYMLPDDRQSNHFLVESGEELVAAVLCPWYPESGWIRQFAVRRDHRRRGLGRALLLHAFGDLYRRGQRRVGLGVDSWNTTGARAFYESCGMRETLRHDKYSKTLG